MVPEQNGACLIIFRVASSERQAPLPECQVCLDLLEERRSQGRDAFAVPVPPMADLVSRWGEDWAWRKRLWYPCMPHSELPAGDLAFLAQKGPAWLYELIVSQHLPASQFMDFARDADPRIRWALASSPACPEDCLHKFAADRDAVVRAAVAASANCPPAWRAQLIRDSDWRVRVSAMCGLHSGAWNDLDASTLEYLANDCDPQVRRVVIAAPGLPMALAAKLADDTDGRVRQVAAGHVRQRKSPFDRPEHHTARNRILQKLMFDPDERVREASADGGQPFLFYEEHARTMTRDTAHCTRWVLARNTRNPELLARLAGDGHWAVRIAAAENPNTPADTLIAMCRTYGFQEAVNLVYRLANHPCLPAEAICLLIDKEREYRLLHPRAFMLMLISDPEQSEACDQADGKVGDFFEEQANLSPKQMIECLPLDENNGHVADYAKCRSYFPDLMLLDKMRQEHPEMDSQWDVRLYRWALNSQRSMWIAVPAVLIATCAMAFHARNATRRLVRVNNGGTSVLAEPSPQAIEELFAHMLASKDSKLRAAALKNAHCPAAKLLKAAEHYLAHIQEEDKGGLRTAIGHISANPALPRQAKFLLLEQMKQNPNRDVIQGLLRKPNVNAEEWLELAGACEDGDYRRDIGRALWLWHGWIIPER
jgi:hypothetical protein